MGKFCCFVGKNILNDQKLCRAQAFFSVTDIGFGIGQIFSEDPQGPDFFSEQSLDHGVDHQSRLVGKRLNFPGFHKLFPIFGYGHVLIARENNRQCAHIASALHIVLTPQRIDAAEFNAHVAQQHLEIGAGHNVVGAAGMLCYPQRINQHRRPGGGHFMSDLNYLFGGYTADFGCFFGRILHDRLFELIEARAVLRHEFFVIQIFINQNIHNAVEESHIGADLDLGENIGHFCQFMAAGIGHNELCAL